MLTGNIATIGMACQRSKFRMAPCCAPEIRANGSECSVGDWECPREQSSIKCSPRSCAPFRPSTDCPTMRLRGQLRSRRLIVVRPIMSGSFNSIWRAVAFCRDLGHGQIGNAHVRTPVNNAHLVYSHLLEKKNNTQSRQHIKL